MIERNTKIFITMWKITIALLICSSTSYASVCCRPENTGPRIAYLSSIYENPCIDFFRGFYAGANIGYRWGLNGLKIDGDAPAHLDRDKKTSLATLFRLGYGHVYEALFVGIEAGYEYRSLEQPSTYDTPVFNTFVNNQPAVPPTEGFPVTTIIRAQHSATLDFLPGFVVTPRTLVYARFGVEYSRYTWVRHFSIVELIAADPGDPQTLIAREFRHTDSETNHGFRLGLGVARAITSHVSVDLNYIHEVANNLIFQKTRIPVATTDSFFGLPTALPGFLSSKNTIRPDRNEVNIGVTFRF